MFAGLARDEIIGLSNGEGCPEVESDPARGTFRARHGAEKIGHVRLGALVKLHVDMDREGVAALHAQPFPFPVGVEIAPVDGKRIGFTDGAANR